MECTTNSAYKKTPMGTIPADWSLVPVGEIASVDYGISEPVSGNYNACIGIPILTGANITLEGKIDTSNLVYIEKRDNDRFALQKGDLLFNWRSGSQKHIGKTAVFDLDGEYTYASFILRIRLKEGNDPYFYHQLFNYLKDTGYFAGETSAQVNFKLNASLIKKLKLVHPPYHEQRKIAAILATWDRAVELNEQLIQQVKVRKQGLMQQLLAGKARLPGFSTEWTRHKIRDLITETNDTTTENNQYEVLSVTKNGIIPQKLQFNKQIASADNTGYKIVRKHNLVFSTMNLWMGSLDVLTGQEIGIVSPAYKVFRFNEQKMNPIFGKYFMLSDHMIRVYRRNSEQGASIVRRNLDLDGLLNTTVTIPPLAEQAAIARVLQAADEEIRLLHSRLAALRQQKKGLMQLLLTGKIRVKCC